MVNHWEPRHQFPQQILQQEHRQCHCNHPPSLCFSNIKGHLLRSRTKWVRVLVNTQFRVTNLDPFLAHLNKTQDRLYELERCFTTLSAANFTLTKDLSHFFSQHYHIIQEVVQSSKLLECGCFTISGYLWGQSLPPSSLKTLDILALNFLQGWNGVTSITIPLSFFHSQPLLKYGFRDSFASITNLFRDRKSVV